MAQLFTRRGSFYKKVEDNIYTHTSEGEYIYVPPFFMGEHLVRISSLRWLLLRGEAA